MKDYTYWVFVVFFLLFVLAITESSGQKPNITCLMTDDQNVGSVGCYGNNEVFTPNMDKIGEEGIMFMRHYNTTAICIQHLGNDAPEEK